MSKVVPKINTLRKWLLGVKIDIICQQINLAMWVNILVMIILFDVAISLLGYYSEAKIEHSLKDLATRRMIIALFKKGERKKDTIKILRRLRLVKSWHIICWHICSDI